MKNRVYLILRIALLIGIFGTLLFTFTQSLLPPEESAEVSESVSEILETIIPSDTPVGEYVHDNVRKIAHFVEYFILGCFTSLYVVIFMPKIESEPRGRIRYCIYSLVISPIISLFDETLQIISERGPSITDVWLDTAGFFVSSVTIYAVFFTVMYIIRKKKSQQIN